MQVLPVLPGPNTEILTRLALRLPSLIAASRSAAESSVADEEAAMKVGKRRVNRGKITLVGPGRAGKTCVASSFLSLALELRPPSARLRPGREGEESRRDLGDLRRARGEREASYSY